MAEQEYTPTEAETTSPHRIDITLDAWGNVAAKLSCSAPVGAPCRLWCDEGCEYADEEHRKGHVLADQGSCARTVGWFDDAPLELYDGPEVPLRSGPVVLSWDGDTYLWSYAPDERAKRPDRQQLRNLVDRVMTDSWSYATEYDTVPNAVADAVFEALALEPEAREVAEEQFMLRISATWDEDGKQHMPDLVGPFVSEHAAMLWMQAQAPFFGSYATSPWPASPEEVSRG